MTVPCAPTPLTSLRAEIAAMDVRSSGSLPFGVAGLDDRLAGGGLGHGALHEVAPASSALGDDAAATLFVAGAAARLARQRAGRVLWALTGFDLYAPGLEQAGLAARLVLFAQAREDGDALALAEDGARDTAIAAVVVEARRVGMVASRRLQLAAGDRGVPVILLRRWRRLGACPLEEPSAAATRWRIGCAASVPLAVPGVGRARWRVELVRQRGGAPFSLLLEACDDQGRLSPSPPPADRASAPAFAGVRAA